MVTSSERTSVMRRLITAAGEIAALAYEEREEVDEVIDQAERILFEVSSTPGEQGSGARAGDHQGLL